MKNPKNPTGNRTRGLPACSAVPQPTPPPSAPLLLLLLLLLLLVVVVVVAVAAVVSVTKTSLLVMFREIIRLYSKNHVRNMNTKCVSQLRSFHCLWWWCVTCITTVI